MEEQIQNDDDLATFVLELSGLLKELRCPYTSLITGHVSDRYQDISTRIQLIDFLVTELMSLKMYIANRPTDTSNIITIVKKKIIYCLSNENYIKLCNIFFSMNHQQQLH